MENMNGFGLAVFLFIALPALLIGAGFVLLAKWAGLFS